MTDYFGAQATQFMDDLVTIISGASQWGTDFGVKPRITKRYDRKVTGLAVAKSESILIYVDRESIKPFTIGVGVSPTKSWYHTLTASIEIQSNVSDTRLDQLLDAVIHILKSNVTYTGYVQIMPKAIKMLGEEQRGGFAAIIDVEGQKYAPIRTV